MSLQDLSFSMTQQMSQSREHELQLTIDYLQKENAALRAQVQFFQLQGKYNEKQNDGKQNEIKDS